MCRFTFYQGRPIRIGSLITEPKHSLINQSINAQEREEPLNGDGFGLAWYQHAISSEPALFKSISPAWNNNNLQELCRIIETDCILAHVRAATQGLSVMESNCHPFKRGKFAFMHNGDIGGFQKIRRHLLNLLSDQGFQQLKGSTDSEHFFTLMMDRYDELTTLETGDRMATAMMWTIRKVTELVKQHGPGEHCYLNMVLSDGKIALALRFTTDDPDNADTLYLNLGKKYVCEDGVCYMEDPGDHEKAVIISSEPLSKEPGWEMIPGNSMILIEDGKIRDKMEIHLAG